MMEYLDVFPDELHRLPPEREVEYTIELMLSIKPLFIFTYKMAPTELKELNKQL